MSNSVYKSTTMGDIPLSFTGKHLMQALRDEMTDLVAKVVKDVEAGKPVVTSSDWDPLSRAHGRLEKYISELEGKNLERKTNINEMYGKFAAAPSVYPNKMRQAPLTHHDGALYLPSIPEGYELKIVGSVVSIAPIEQMQLQIAPQKFIEPVPKSDWFPKDTVERELFTFSNLRASIVTLRNGKNQPILKGIRIIGPLSIKEGKRGLNLTKLQARTLGEWLVKTSQCINQ